jgi:hypothetical protein
VTCRRQFPRKNVCFSIAAFVKLNLFSFVSVPFLHALGVSLGDELLVLKP